MGLGLCWTKEDYGGRRRKMKLNKKNPKTHNPKFSFLSVCQNAISLA